MPVAWNPDRWWDWCISEDEKKEIVRVGSILSWGEKIVYVFWNKCTKKQFSVCYIIQTNSVSILFANYIY